MGECVNKGVRVEIPLNNVLSQIEILWNLFLQIFCGKVAFCKQLFFTCSMQNYRKKLIFHNFGQNACENKFPRK